LPTWAVVEHQVAAAGQGNALPRELAHLLRDAGASVVLFEVPSVDAGVAELAAARSALSDAGLKAGVLLAASANAVRGFDDDVSALDHWVSRAVELALSGARVVGGGAGTTEAHTRALVSALNDLHPSLPPPERHGAC
jgi:5-methyltetrahydrofolate--homocysteine methyltransferase